MAAQRVTARVSVAQTVIPSRTCPQVGPPPSALSPPRRKAIEEGWT